MTWNGTILDFGGTFADRNRIDNLPGLLAWRGATFRIAHAPPGPKMPDQLFLEHPAGLDKQTAIDGFVTVPQTLLLRADEVIQ
jgi:hypothetical protein